MSEHRSADRLRERLAQHPGAMGAYHDEVLYNVQVEMTCRLLDVVDEATDSFTAGLITDAICERLTGDGVSEASQRMREKQAELERLMMQPPAPITMTPGEFGEFTRKHGVRWEPL